MVMDAEQWAEARRLVRLEGYSIRKTARRLGVDPKTVKRALGQTTFLGSKPRPGRRGSILDPFRTVVKTLAADDELSATQIHERLTRQHGWKGHISLVRRFVATLRLEKADAFLKLTFVPGECAQVDWGYYGRITIGKTRRRVSAFVMVLAHSRLMYVELTLSERMDAFLEAHVRALRYFGGSPARMLYDNCKTVVLERLASARRFHPRLLELADHYGFQVRACPPRRPWHKGRVESGIGYVWKSFRRGRAPVVDLEREGRDLALWRDEVANVRLHATTRRKPRELFEEVERATLRPLPENDADTALVESSVSVNGSYRIHFDGNLYTVPFQLAHRRGLVLKATTRSVEIFYGEERVAQHARNYDRGADVIDPEHDRGLREKKRRADRHVVLGRLVSLLGVEVEDYASGLARSQVRASHHLERILGLVDRYGVADVREALLRALAHGAFGADYVENVVHQARRSRLASPASTLPVLRDEQLASVVLREPDLSRLDHLFTKGDDRAGRPEAESQPKPEGQES